MKVMIISDLHYDRRIFHGVDESKAWSWLMDVVNYHRPDILLSCGDWGAAINQEEFLEAAKKLMGEDVDVLLMHETPYLPNLFPFMRDSIGSRTALETIKIVKPRLVINGHMHSCGYKIRYFPWGTKYLYIDSSQENRHYVILNTDNMELEVWRDLEVIHHESLHTQ